MSNDKSGATLQSIIDAANSEIDRLMSAGLEVRLEVQQREHFGNRDSLPFILVRVSRDV